MIKDDWEYEVTQDCIEQFEKSIDAIEKDEEKKRDDPER
jgi:hypothetical protein